MSVFVASNYEVEVRISPPCQENHPWMQMICSTIKNGHESHHDTLGTLHAYLLDRTKVTDFYRDLRDYSLDTSILAFTLFDRHGNIKREFKEHVVKKGSGIWGSELDVGQLLILERIKVEPGYRRQGLGKQLVCTTLEHVRAQTYNPFFALASPSAVKEDVEAESGFPINDIRSSEVKTRLRANNRSFFRTMDFRNLGNSPFLAWASDPQHPSHHLAVANDFNPPPEREPDINPETKGLIGAAVYAPDPSLRYLLDAFYEGRRAGDAYWRVPIAKGNTILHVVATAMKPLSTAWVLSRCPGLRDVRNYEGHTALEAVEWCIEEERTRSEYFGEFGRSVKGDGEITECAAETLGVLRG